MTTNYQGPRLLKALVDRFEYQGFNLATEIYLTGPQVTDEQIEPLRQMRSLKIVLLEDTKVSRKAIEELESALPHCRIGSFGEVALKE